MRSKPRRNLQDIRTMTDLVSETKNPQRKFLKLAVLEMEKTRRGHEVQSAQERIDNIDNRLVEIEAEQSDLLEMVSRARQDEEAAEGQPPPANKSARNGRGGFTLRY